jgi:hypothetical protein
MSYATLYLRLVANCKLAEGQNENGRWVWTGTKDDKGYGRLSIRKPGKKNPTGVRAHRLMHELMVGHQLHPDNETVEHECHNTSCINPDHLTLLTRAQNTAAMRARRRNTF